MDHGVQFEREDRVMSEVQVGVDVCDNQRSPEALIAQTRNLNEPNTLTQTQSLSPSQQEDGGGLGLVQKASLSNNGKDMEEEQEKEGYSRRGREEDEEEDIDEVMKEEEEEEEVSEGSSSLIRCLSPDTPMTDSSYSETGSLLEAPCPFSPRTSPEPTSPVMPVVSPDAGYTISQVSLSQIDVKVETQTSNTESVASNTESITLGPTLTTRPIDSTTLTLTSDTRSTTPPVPTCITEATDRIAKNPSFPAEHFTSSTNAGPITSTAETLTVTACTTRLSASIDSSLMSATRGPLTCTTGPWTKGTQSTFTTGPISSDWEQIISTPVPTCFSASTSTTGPIPSHALLESLELLAQRGDDTHLPQYLHQIAEAFVLHEDYQRALWCIQLERLYHQRTLDNLKALEEQWESQCRRTSPNLATQHLDTLKHICQTHSRPRAKDAAFASLNILRPTLEEGGALPPCTSARQVDRGMEQRAEDSSRSQSSHPVIPSVNLADGLNSPEISEKDGEDRDRELEGRAGFHGSQLTVRQGSDREGGEVEGRVGYTISVTGNKLHPSSAEEMDQSKPAEPQGGDLDLIQEKEAKKEEEERDVEEATEALEMEDEGEDEEEEKQIERGSPSHQKALPVETLVSGADVEVQQLYQESLAEEKLHEESQESAKLCLQQDTHLPQEAHMKQQEQVEREEEEEEYDYEVDPADMIREAATLDDMAKLITVEEISPASGLVSILKKRNVCVDNVSVSGSSEPRTDKPPAKRRVRFKVPDDGYEQDVGGGDSCLLLFLLCLVTVVISIGGTALYCALGDAHSSVCQDFSRNADFYTSQIRRGISHIQHWFTPGS